MAGKGDLALSADAWEFVRLAGKTSQLPPRIKRNLRREVRAVGETAADASRAEVRRAPLYRGSAPRRTGLRLAIAAGIKVQLAAAANRRAGVRIRATAAALPPEKAVLVKRWNRKSGWRHPVYGKTGVWAEQKGRPYFGSVIAQHREELRAGVRRAMNEALETLK